MRLRLFSDQSGNSMVEAAIVLPLIMAAGLVGVDYAYVAVRSQALTTGVRDGARYLSRFNDADLGAASTFVTNAKNLVVFGNIEGTGAGRIKNMTVGDVTITPPCSTAGSTFANTTAPVLNGGSQLCLVTVSATVSPSGFGFASLLRLGSPVLRASHTERMIEDLKPL